MNIFEDFEKLKTMFSNASLEDASFEVSKPLRGRFKEEMIFNIMIKVNHDFKAGENIRDILIKKFLFSRVIWFTGRKPWYLPWMEVSYVPEIMIEKNNTIRVSEKEWDQLLIRVLSNMLPPGSHIMITYDNHHDVLMELEKNVPVVATRIGYLLFLSGFTWFKDWYFPEGLKEGNVKIQGEKPLDHESETRHLKNLMLSIENFLDESRHLEEPFFERPVYRANKILAIVKKKLASTT